MRPSFAQEEYAEALVKRLRDENQWNAESYARLVMNCQDKETMSKLISVMKADLEALDKMGTEF